MNFIDYMIIAIILLAAFYGFRKGVLNATVTFVGSLIVIILAYYLKTPISILMYQYLPFFDLGGRFSGITIFNVLLYEGISYLATIVILAYIFRILIKVTGVVEKFMNATLVMGIPSKILGTFVGLLQGYVLAFIIVFLLAMATPKGTEESTFAPSMLEGTPILSKIVGNTYNTVSEIYRVVTLSEGAKNKNEANLQALDIILQYEILSTRSADKLIETGKLSTPGAALIVDKHRR